MRSYTGKIHLLCKKTAPLSTREYNFLKAEIIGLRKKLQQYGKLEDISERDRFVTVAGRLRLHDGTFALELKEFSYLLNNPGMYAKSEIIEDTTFLFSRHFPKLTVTHLPDESNILDGYQ